MTRTCLYIFLVPALLGGLLGGCSEKIEPKPITYSQLLTGTEKKSWRIVSFQIFDDGNASGVIPAAQLDAPCVIDDLYTFYANDERKFEITEGASKCNANNPDVFYTDNWTLINADASLEFGLRILNLKYPYTIKSLTASVLTIEFYVPDINASYRFTFNATNSK